MTQTVEERRNAVTIYQGDCLDVMATLADRSVDMVLADLPYGTTDCKWDVQIDLVRMWAHFSRCLQPNGAIVLTASQPFTSVLVCSNLKGFRYEWIWEKDGGSNFATTKWQPMKEHESVLVFGNDGKTNYFPIPQERIGSRKGKRTTTTHKPRDAHNVYNSGRLTGATSLLVPEMRCPRSIQRFTRERGLHPTQKPVDLFAYFIRTYSNPGEVVLDCTAGSGTTGEAALREGRSAILIDDKADCIATMRQRLPTAKLRT